MINARDAVASALQCQLPTAVSVLSVPPGDIGPRSRPPTQVIRSGEVARAFVAIDPQELLPVHRALRITREPVPEPNTAPSTVWLEPGHSDAAPLSALLLCDHCEPLAPSGRERHRNGVPEPTIEVVAGGKRNRGTQVVHMKRHCSPMPFARVELMHGRIDKNIHIATLPAPRMTDANESRDRCRCREHRAQKRSKRGHRAVVRIQPCDELTERCHADHHTMLALNDVGPTAGFGPFWNAT